MFLTLLVVLLVVVVVLVELRPQRLADAGRAVGEILHDPRRRAAVPTHLKWEMYQCNDRAICMNILWGNGMVVMGSYMSVGVMGITYFTTTFTLVTFQ